MKIISFYLPQFHCIPENDEWWGKGFTEWVNVKKAKPLYKGHYQPREPLSDNYYNLLNDEVMRWQVSMAKKYGVYGFCFYHYWFDGKLLLEKPVENYLKNKNLDLPFCICWANENWTNTWAASNTKVLIAQGDGTEEKWREHFYYLLPYLKDSRYICVDSKPLIVIYKPEMDSHMEQMLELWKELAIKEGLAGLVFASQLMPKDISKSKFDLFIEYQPTYTYINMTKSKNSFIVNMKSFLKKLAMKLFKIDLEGVKSSKLRVYNYENFWKKIIETKPINERCVAGAFVDWDNTPRKQKRGFVIDGASPEKFYTYMKKQIANVKENYKSDMIFMFAWNEWAEGGYLEPDKKFGYGYLEALNKAMLDSGISEN